MRDIAIAGAFAMLAGLLPAAAALTPKAGAPVAVIASPFARDGAAVRIVAAADGFVLGTTGRGGVAVATSAATDFVARLYQSGASIVVDASVLSACLSIASEPSFSAKRTDL